MGGQVVGEGVFVCAMEWKRVRRRDFAGKCLFKRVVFVDFSQTNGIMFVFQDLPGKVRQALASR